MNQYWSKGNLRPNKLEVWGRKIRDDSIWGNGYGITLNDSVIIKVEDAVKVMVTIVMSVVINILDIICNYKNFYINL